MLRRFLIVLAAIVVSTGAPATGHAGVDADRGVAQGEHCVTVIKKVKPPRPETVVTHRSCGKDAERAVEALPNTSVLIVKFWQNSFWEGKSDSVYGEDGPCDASGYGLPDTRSANLLVQGISSCKWYNQCSGQELFYDAFYWTSCGIRDTAQVSYVGQQCNDHLWSMKLYKWYV